MASPRFGLWFRDDTLLDEENSLPGHNTTEGWIVAQVLH